MNFLEALRISGGSVLKVNDCIVFLYMKLDSISWKEMLLPTVATFNSVLNTVVAMSKEIAMQQKLSFIKEYTHNNFKISLF